MRILRPIIFVAILLLMVEFSFRVYLFGVASLNPRSMNSYTQINDSGLTQPAAVPEVYFELKPNLDTWYKGAAFSTNSAGMRDKEYTLAKPENTYRVAVLGSSWTMGSGVKADNVWHSVLENKLNAADRSLQIEFINFGVDQYGIGEIIATLEHKVPAYQPDLVIVAITQYTPTIAWPQPPVPYTVQPKRNPFFDCYTLRVIDTRFGLGIYSDSDERRDAVSEPGQLRSQLEQAVNRMDAFSRRFDVPVVVAKLAYTAGWTIKEPAYEKYLATASDRIVYLSTLKAIRAQGYAPKQLRISTWDSHPNSLAHGLIADAIGEGLTANGLLPLQ